MTAEEDATVLVVEDEEALADTYARWLADRYAVEVVYTGEEAVERIDERVDVALLDRRLPGMSGGDVLDAIRDRGVDCRVAMLTAVDPDFDVFEMPFDDYVVKPVLQEELNGLVERLLRLSSYDEKAQESFALASKVSVLEESKSREELDGNSEYAAAKERLDAVDEDIQETLSEFEAEDFASAYRDLAADE
ncbi:MAG: response regulator [Halobacteriaceae archaeon]